MMDKYKYRLFGVVSILILCIGLTYKYLQTDTFYMIKLGDFITHHGIDFLDHYCWVANLAYTYPHWLYDVFIYYIYASFGYFGIYVSVIVIYFLLSLCIYYVNLKCNKNEFFSIVLSILIVFQLSMFAVARAQLISLMCFVLEFYFIYQLIETGKKRYIFGLWFLCVLVANVHATVWPFYFILFLPFIGGHLVYLWFSRKGGWKNHFKLQIVEIKNIRKLIFTFIVSLFLGILSPSKICYTYIFRVMMGNSQHFLTEHFPLVLVNYPFLGIIILILLGILIFTNVKIYLHELLMLGGLLFMSFCSVRHLSFFYTIGLIVIGIICIRCLNLYKDKTFDILGSLLIGNKFIYLGALLLVVGLSGSRFLKHLDEAYVKKNEYPVDAVAYIKENLDYKNMRLYNGYNYGSYLLFQDIPVFIDARCDLYLKEFNGMNYSIFDEFSNMESHYEKRFLNYDVTHVLVSKKEGLFLILKHDSNYKVLYEDKYFILYERLS